MRADRDRLRARAPEPSPNLEAGALPYPTRYYTAGAIPPTSGPFGGVLHSTPAIETPPNALLRDDSYQAFTTAYTSAYTTYLSTQEPRHTVLYVATIDGLLHAYGVDYNASDPYTFIGSSLASDGGTSGLQNEMWTFVPPAVMPNMMGAVGGGETILLDGAPVVKDTIFQRTAVGPGTDWHTSLGAGFGAAMGGYYALDVTDPNFNDRGTSPNTFQPQHATSNSNTPPQAPSGVRELELEADGAATILWQRHGHEPLPPPHERDAGDHDDLVQRPRQRQQAHRGRRRDPSGRVRDPGEHVARVRPGLVQPEDHGREPAVRLSARGQSPAVDQLRLPQRDESGARPIAHDRPPRHG